MESNMNSEEILYRKALNFAAIKHAAQKRKGTEIPYIVHPFEVSQILRDNGCSLLIQAAGLLHDCLEDTDTTSDEIVKEFGPELCTLVENESENKSKTWKERKQITVNRVAVASKETQMICCADKLSNLRSMSFDFSNIGDKLWERFNASKENIQWYYSSIARALNGLSDMAMHKELVKLVDELF